MSPYSITWLKWVKGSTRMCLSSRLQFIAAYEVSGPASTGTVLVFHYVTLQVFSASCGPPLKETRTLGSAAGLDNYLPINSTTSTAELWKYRNIFVFSIISQRWDGTSNGNSLSSMTRSWLLYIVNTISQVNTMVPCVTRSLVLVTQGTMVLTLSILLEYSSFSTTEAGWCT